MASLQWRVKPVLPVTKLLGAVALVVLALAFSRGDPVQWVLALVVAAAVVGWAARDLIRPVRLAADHTGITVVAGYATRRHLPWSTIEQVRVDDRARRGVRSELLEIDAGESLHLFSANELGADPADVAEALAAYREAASRSERESWRAP